MRQNNGQRRHDLKSIARRVMVERGLLPEFSSAVMAEVARSRAATDGGAPGVRDLRELLWCSIDNEDSRDLDQLTVAEAIGDGAVRILVAIADVDAVVAQGSATDGHARHNTTSVYTAAAIFPMLPERLSTDLTSLGEGEERLALVVETTVNADGTVGAAELYRAMVKNRAKLAYPTVGAWLEGTGPIPEKAAGVPGMEAQLRLQDQVAERLREVRHHHGALSLVTVQARPVFEGGTLTDLTVEHPNRARALIEDFMITTNGVTARYLAAQGYPLLRRVLRSPERWGRIVALAAGLGASLPPEPDAAALDAFLVARRQADPLRFPDLSLAIVKLMGRGEYVVELPGRSVPGHFGLAIEAYAHSTAPNRRFPDVIAQRLAKAALLGRPAPYTTAELQELAQHCTEAEDRANKVERQLGKSAAALLLEPRIGQSFEALVTGASQKGTWVRLLQPPVEGKLVHGADGLDVGDRVQVTLVATDVERGFIDFARGNGSPAPNQRSRRTR
jgi:exoribonuclease-2